MYKANGYLGTEVEHVILASEIIDCFNIYGNLKYEESNKHGVRTSRSKLMATEQKSVVPANDVKMWCRLNSIDFLDFVLRNWKKEYAQMAVIDYLIANYDRHLWNWGFFQDVGTGNLLGLHPLYDHNYAFFEDYLMNEELESALDYNYSQKKLAEIYTEASKLRLLQVPSKEMFPNQLAHEVFIDRCRQLKLFY
jgi:hypothetical protein